MALLKTSIRLSVKLILHGLGQGCIMSPPLLVIWKYKPYKCKSELILFFVINRVGRVSNTLLVKGSGELDTPED